MHYADLVLTDVVSV